MSITMNTTYTRSHFPFEFRACVSDEIITLTKNFVIHRPHNILNDVPKSKNKVFHYVHYDSWTTNFINDLMNHTGVTRIVVDHDNSNAMFISNFTFNKLNIKELLQHDDIIVRSPLKRYDDIMSRYRIHDEYGDPPHSIPIEDYIALMNNNDHASVPRLYTWFRDNGYEDHMIEIDFQPQVQAYMAQIGVLSSEIENIARKYDGMISSGQIFTKVEQTNDPTLIPRGTSYLGYYYTCERLEKKVARLRAVRSLWYQALTPYLLKFMKTVDIEYLYFKQEMIRYFQIIRTLSIRVVSPTRTQPCKNYTNRLHLWNMQMGREYVQVDCPLRRTVIDRTGPIAMAVPTTAYINQLGIPVHCEKHFLPLFTSINVLRNVVENYDTKESTFEHAISQLSFVWQTWNRGIPLLVIDNAFSTHVKEDAYILTKLMRHHKNGYMIINTKNHYMKKMFVKQRGQHAKFESSTTQDFGTKLGH